LVRSLAERSARRQRATLDASRARLALQTGLLRALEPRAVLGRGYAVLSDAATRAPIGRVAELAPGRTVRADLADGALVGRIETVEPAPTVRVEAGA
jgi:exodeoxyribonuclease VII large subunit